MLELFYSAIYAFLFLILSYKVLQYKNYPLLVITSVWSISALAGIIYCQIPYIAFFYKIEFLPFLYLFLCFCISILPFKNFSEKNIIRGRIICNPLILKILIYAIALCSFEPFLEILIIIAQRGMGGLADIYIDSEEGFDPKYFFSFVGRYLYTIEDYFKFIAVPLFFLYLNTKNVRKWIIIGLVCAILTPTLFSLANGHRFYLITVGLSILFNYILFRGTISDKHKKMLKKYFYVSLAFLSIMFISISVSRFGKGSDYALEGYGTGYQFVRYLGESHGRFNSDIWHQTRLTKGKNSWLGYYGTFQKKKQMDIRERNNTTGFMSNVFFTYIGDLCMDYGKTTTIIIITITSLLFCCLARNFKRHISLCQIIIINLYANVLLFGFTYFIYKNGFLNMLWSIVVAFVISVTTRTNHDIRKYTI